MSSSAQQSGEESPSAAERLRHELFRMLSAQTEQVAHTVEEKAVHAARRLIEPAEKVKEPVRKIKDTASHSDHPGRALAGQVKDTVRGSLPGSAGRRGDGSGDSGDGGGGEGGSEGGTSSGGSHAKVTTVSEAVDVGVPLRTCYDHWTDLQSFEQFTRGVRAVSASDETTSEWTFRIAFSERSHHAEIEEQIPDDRIVWRSESDKGTTHGAVTFHALAPSLTRVLVVIAYHPGGVLEKLGNLWRAQGRRVRLDLKQFQRHVTLAGETAPAGWRGEIRDGEVCRSHEEATRSEQDGDG